MCRGVGGDGKGRKEGNREGSKSTYLHAAEDGSYLLAREQLAGGALDSAPA